MVYAFPLLREGLDSDSNFTHVHTSPLASVDPSFVCLTVLPNSVTMFSIDSFIRIFKFLFCYLNYISGPDVNIV